MHPTPSRMLQITGASGNNLKHVTLNLPVGLLICITGVSGSGQVHTDQRHAVPRCRRHLYGSNAEPAPYEELNGLEFYDKVINVDQSPIGRTPRSIPPHIPGYSPRSGTVCRRTRVTQTAVMDQDAFLLTSRVGAAKPAKVMA